MNVRKNGGLVISTDEQGPTQNPGVLLVERVEIMDKV
jgi:hypothetical protein